MKKLKTYLSILAEAVTIVGFPILIYQVMQAQYSLELASVPVVQVDSSLKNGVFKVKVKNKSLSLLKDIKISVHTFEFPSRVSDQFRICRTFPKMENTVMEIKSGNSEIITFDLNERLYLLDQARTQAYGGYMISAIRLDIIYVRDLDNSSFSYQEIYDPFDENTLLNFRGVFPVIYEVNNFGKPDSERWAYDQIISAISNYDTNFIDTKCP